MLNIKQKGLSPIGVLFVICVFAFSVIAGLKLAPYYIDYNTLRSVYEEKAGMADFKEMAPEEKISSISKALTMNNVRDFDIRENSYFMTEEGEKVLGFKYEVRQHMFANIDVVLSFSYEKGLE